MSGRRDTGAIRNRMFFFQETASSSTPVADSIVPHSLAFTMECLHAIGIVEKGESEDDREQVWRMVSVLLGTLAVHCQCIFVPFAFVFLRIAASHADLPIFLSFFLSFFLFLLQNRGDLEWGKDRTSMKQKTSRWLKIDNGRYYGDDKSPVSVVRAISNTLAGAGDKEFANGESFNVIGRGGDWVATTIQGLEREIKKREEEVSRSEERSKLLKEIIESGGTFEELMSSMQKDSDKYGGWQGDDIWQAVKQWDASSSNNQKKRKAT